MAWRSCTTTWNIYRQGANGTSESSGIIAINNNTSQESLLDTNAEEDTVHGDIASSTMGARTTRRWYPERPGQSPEHLKGNTTRKTKKDSKALPKVTLNGYEKDDWPEAMEKEIQTIKEIKCWTAVSRTSRDKAIYSKFEKNRKEDHTGAINKYKSLLVVCVELKNFTMKNGIS